MSERDDYLVKDNEGEIGELDLDFEEWQIKLLKILREWFPGE